MGTKRAGGSRRERREIRTEQIPIRFSPTEKAMLERVADGKHEYPSSFLRRLILEGIENDGLSMVRKAPERQMA